MDEPINQRKYAELQMFRILKDLEHHFSDEEIYNGSDDQVTSKIKQLIGELSLESKIPDICEINSVSEISP